MLAVDNVSVTLDGAPILRDVSFAVGTGEVLVVLGPSGSGKSTLLRTIAGLQQPTEGTVRWNGTDLSPTPPHRRKFGFMFQDLALFPHRSVAGNVAFGLEMAGAADVSSSVGRVLEMVGLEEMQDRSTETLSGGEQQRVALARSLAPEPRLLMLDEPLGSLDRILRQRLTADLRAIFDGLDTAVLYVTHDQEEALAMADRVAVLNDGRIEQVGSPEEVWRSPATEFVARFVGWSEFADGDARGGFVDTPWGRVRCRAQGQVRVGLPPHAAALDPAGALDGVVTSSVFSGEDYRTRIRPGIGPDVEVASASPLPVGATVRWSVDPSVVAVFGR